MSPAERECWDGLPPADPWEEHMAAWRLRHAQPTCPQPGRRERWYCSGDASSRLPDWRILSVVDHGPTEHYRYEVQGYNLNSGVFEYGRAISWRVPSISDPRYDISRATFTHAARDERKAS